MIMRSQYSLIGLVLLLTSIHNTACSLFTDEKEGLESPEPNIANQKPNIVIILADDVGTGDLPFWHGYETSLVDMPNLQKLANDGLKFTDAHSSPLCAPSRYMLLSGNYPHRGESQYGIWNINSNRNQFRGNQKSIAQVLRDDAGYKTLMLGKWHLGGRIPPNGIQSKNIRRVLTHPGHDWSLPLQQGPGDIGFEKSYITAAGIQSAPYAFFRDDHLEISPSDVKYWDGGQYPMESGTSIIVKRKHGEGDPNWDSSAYDMILVNETEKFIKNHVAHDSDKPFFAYIALGAVHGPHSPADVYLDGSQIKDKYPTEHLDMLGAMDKAVGSIVSIIEDHNLADNTIIMFTSDNGGLNKANTVETGHLTGGKLRGHKRDIWEGGHRVPFILRWDNNIAPGRKRKRMIGLNDVYATICDIAGVNVPSGSAQDSVSFAPYIKSAQNKQGLRKYLGMFQLHPARHWQHAIRYKFIKLVHHPHNNTFEAYNLKKDISESRNVIGNTWVRQRIPAMFEKLKEIGPCPDKDRVGTFKIKGLGENYSCVFFLQNRWACNNYAEGEMFCPSICTNRFRNKCWTQGMYGNTFN